MPRSTTNAAFAVIALALVAFVGCNRPRVSGYVRADATPVGSFQFTVSDCSSAEVSQPGRLGVALRADDGFDLQVFGTGRDAQLMLYPKGVRYGAITIRDGSCPKWEVLVEKTYGAERYRGLNPVKGYVRVDCMVGGGVVVGDVTFAMCGS